MKTFLIFIVQVCWNSSCSLTSCQDQVSLASPPVIRLFWKVICAGGRVCVLCHSPPRHTHTEQTLKDASKLSKCILSWCSWISLCVCILHAAILLYVCMWMFMCVCVVFVRWGCSPWGGGCTDHFQSREICSPLHEQNVPGCRYDSRASQKKALMCFDSSAVKRSVMPRLSVLFIPNHRADKQNTKADSRLAESSGGAERGCRDNFQQGGSLHSVLPLSQCLQRKTVRCSNVCQLTAGFRCLSEK